MSRVGYYAEIWKNEAKNMSTKELKFEIRKYVPVRDSNIRLDILEKELDSRKVH